MLEKRVCTRKYYFVEEKRRGTSVHDTRQLWRHELSSLERMILVPKETIRVTNPLTCVYTWKYVYMQCFFEHTFFGVFQQWYV